MNQAEQEVADELRADGYEVLKRGWPDFIAVRGQEVRFIEVKPCDSTMKLSSHQARVAEVFAMLGLKVETWSEIDAAFSEERRLERELREEALP